MRDFILELLNSNFATAVCTVLGAIVGSRISARSSRKEENRRIIALHYGEFVSAYTNFASDHHNDEYEKELVAAIEKLRLFCPKESDIYFSAMFNLVTDPNPDFEKCTFTYEKIQETVRQIANE